MAHGEAMSPLLIIRAQRDRMSAIDRRIADFVLENAHLLRDYSSPQLADALGISQSSVVKFSQRLGFKGYPDLKFSIGEAVARGGRDEEARPVEAQAVEPHAVLADRLWRRKAESEEETRLINTAAQLDAIVLAVREAGHVFVAGLGEDGIHAQMFALRLSLLGIPTTQHRDCVLMTAGLSSARRGDVLLVFSEHGRQHDLCQYARQFRELHGKVVSVTRHSANPLRAGADAALLISAHDDAAHVRPLLYHAALQHMLDLIVVLLCEASSDYRARLDDNLERVHRLLDP
jgi:DNA-binding MurR/RpiR family transcriptional regulator